MYIPLTKGAVARVDPADYERLTQMGSWCLNSSGYAVHYTKINGRRKTLLMHRLLMDAPRHLQVDHINRDKLDNRRENLRFATRSQNQANKNVGKNNTSRFKGVNQNKGKWEARIKYHGRRINLGRFTNRIKAALVYDVASLMLYRDFAGVNFPGRVPAPPMVRYVQKRLQKAGVEVAPLLEIAS
mgnify:CR=1 FL=1